MDEELIPRHRLAFSPFLDELVRVFEETCKKHHPKSSVIFFCCEDCEGLHIEVAEDETAPSMVIPPGQWELKH